jgi:hypothetical protein
MQSLMGTREEQKRDSFPPEKLPQTSQFSSAQAMAETALQAQDATAPVPGPRCPTCGREMHYNYTFAVFSKRRGGKAKAKDRLPTGMRSQKHEKMTYGTVSSCNPQDGL